jgi:hypothetical protein
MRCSEHECLMDASQKCEHPPCKARICKGHADIQSDFCGVCFDKFSEFCYDQPEGGDDDE